MQTNLLKLIFLLTLIFSNTAFAYLDPGTGSLLLSSIVAIFASMLYFAKGIFYKATSLIGGGGNRKNSNLISSNFFKSKNNTFTTSTNSIVIYGEDRRYYLLFKPIIEIFEKIGYPYTYYTSDKLDPILEFKSNIANIKYIGESNTAYTTLNSLTADIVLMTTPQLEVLQVKRSKGVKHYCHIIHSLPHVDTYEVFALDYFDSVFTNSPIHTDFIRQVEKTRGLKTKKIVITGCSYLDELDKKLQDYRNSKDYGKLAFFTNNTESIPTILLAPSWGREAILTKYGMKLIEPLAKSGYNIIIRPHPQSFISEKALLDSLISSTSTFSNVKWDSNTDNIYAMEESSIMIGDYSGVIFDYIALLNKPIITMEFDFNIIGYDLEDIYSTPWIKGVLNEIGVSLKENDFANIKNIIDSTLNSNIKKDNIAKYKELLWKFQGSGGEKSAIELLKIHKEILENRLGDRLDTHKNILALDSILHSTLKDKA